MAVKDSGKVGWTADPLLGATKTWKLAHCGIALIVSSKVAQKKEIGGVVGETSVSL
jgi:hypothetical protein